MAGLDPAIHAFQAVDLGPQRVRNNAAWYEIRKQRFFEKKRAKNF